MEHPAPSIADDRPPDHPRTGTVEVPGRGSLAVRGLTRREVATLQRRCRSADGTLDMWAFEREQFRLGALCDEPLTTADLDLIAERWSARSWDLVILAIDELTDGGYRRAEPQPDTPAALRWVAPYVAKQRHYANACIRPRPTAQLRPRACNRQSRPRARRTAASSSTSSSDPGGNGDPHEPPVAPSRLAPRRAVRLSGLVVA